MNAAQRDAPFIGSEEIASDKTYYEKQVQLPIVECGAKGAPFIGSEEIASDKTYYDNKLKTHAAWIIGSNIYQCLESGLFSGINFVIALPAIQYDTKQVEKNLDS